MRIIRSINIVDLRSLNLSRPLLSIMQRNVEMNDLSSRVHVAELDWSVPFYRVAHLSLTLLVG